MSAIESFTALPNWLHGAELKSVTADSTADLRRGLTEIAGTQFEPDLLVLIGHSNSGVLALDRAEPPLTWPAVAAWFERLAPRRLLVVGCEAGQWLPCRDMFGGIPELRDVFGSPAPLGVRVARILPIAVPFLLHARVNPGVVTAMSFGALLHGEVLIRRTRSDFNRTSDEEGETIQLRDELLAGVMRALRR
ncbi:MAG: hypothetical protein K8T90_12070 [Planctomycetes bacterium]|nr:hypothetical protein [Planctomycetota bacterium]